MLVHTETGPTLRGTVGPTQDIHARAARAAVALVETQGAQRVDTVCLHCPDIITCAEGAGEPPCKGGLLDIRA
jgi:hypothetical protein